jgi:hypothetical protein
MLLELNMLVHGAPSGAKERPSQVAEEPYNVVATACRLRSCKLPFCPAAKARNLPPNV